jgi:hypothetical protein
MTEQFAYAFAVTGGACWTNIACSIMLLLTGTLSIHKVYEVNGTIASTCSTS